MKIGIDKLHLRQCVIRPTLEYLGLWTKGAENLLLGTIAQESQMGHFLQQMGGPALGIYQIEPATHIDLYRHFLSYHPQLQKKIQDLLPSRATIESSALQLITNLSYATAMARLVYYRVSDALPDADDIEGLGYYWKSHYNTHLGKGQISEFVENYKRYVL